MFKENTFICDKYGGQKSSGIVVENLTGKPTE